MEYEDIEFIDYEHKNFYKKQIEKLEETGKADVFHKSAIYTLGICETTRTNFKQILNLETDQINIDSLQSAWQTGGSKRVTRMALNLWNHKNIYESRQDEKEDKVSKNYNVSELFCDGYARYFIQAVKIRYPENFREYQNNKIIFINNQQQNKDEQYGAYIRIGHCQNEVTAVIEVEEKKEQLLKYCKENGYNVNHVFCDIGFSGRLENRISLEKLVSEINRGSLKGMIAESVSTIIREQSFVKTKMFLDGIDGKIVTVHEGVIKENNDKGLSNEMYNTVSEEQRSGRINGRMKLPVCNNEKETKTERKVTKKSSPKARKNKNLER